MHERIVVVGVRGHSSTLRENIGRNHRDDEIGLVTFNTFVREIKPLSGPKTPRPSF